jgi:hypothetical protein
VRRAELDADEHRGGERADLQLVAPSRDRGKQDCEPDDRHFDDTADRRDPVVEAPDREG